jgi:hypothetical protein
VLRESQSLQCINYHTLFDSRLPNVSRDHVLWATNWAPKTRVTSRSGGENYKSNLHILLPIRTTSHLHRYGASILEVENVLVWPCGRGSSLTGLFLLLSPSHSILVSILTTRTLNSTTDRKEDPSNNKIGLPRESAKCSCVSSKHARRATL